MALKHITPEQAGISSRHVEAFLKKLDACGLATHAVLLLRGNDIFCEAYWAPFHKDFCHRQYSQTKSFVGVAVGLLVEDGLVELDAPICRYFPEYDTPDLKPNLRKQTVRHMLTMQTCGGPPDWFKAADPDRTHLYMTENSANLAPGLRWAYDSAGSQVLSSLVERVSGKSLFDFLNERIFRHLDAFQTASVLQCPNGDSWGDSALLCTPRDMAAFARFVMNYGTWEGKRLMNEDYLREATSPLASNDRMGFDSFETQGYGYQIWCLGKKGFFFNGMGSQLTFCYPEEDLIFVINSDNQGNASAKALIYESFRSCILENLSDPLPEDSAAYASLQSHCATLQLAVLAGHDQARFEREYPALQDKVWLCRASKTGITRFSVHFNGDGTGQLRYTNAQGDKVLPFGLGHNVFCKFPEEGYSFDRGGLRDTTGQLYDCAVSAAWRGENRLELRVQIIDRYFGTAIFSVGFHGEDAVLRMLKTAEDFLDTYNGAVPAKLQNAQ